VSFETQKTSVQYQAEGWNMNVESRLIVLISVFVLNNTFVEEVEL
jgi:hypothetical protein